ncbi:hypothetical protein CBR_g49306 [Chara braunii]|uniref:Pentacotripeptide-repeat region of PRORP domain-containing protein n=1 Tax=Chara braunii TaxID=69332 RepID=A0A388M4T6_CHABU|nr:hypothetical protein CBR_g49306 [Chara braunii]|eukprot:GBG89515.1 hypothetical protein CBR_g49306 [Chara braunii]
MSGWCCNQSCVGSVVRSEGLLDEKLRLQFCSGGDGGGDLAGTLSQPVFSLRRTRRWVLRCGELCRRQKCLSTKRNALVGTDGEDRYGKKSCRSKAESGIAVRSRVQLASFNAKDDWGQRTTCAAVAAATRSPACRGSCPLLADAWKAARDGTADYHHQCDAWLILPLRKRRGQGSCRLADGSCLARGAGNRRQVTLHEGLVECAVLDEAAGEENPSIPADPQLRQWVVAGGDTSPFRSSRRDRAPANSFLDSVPGLVDDSSASSSPSSSSPLSLESESAESSSGFASVSAAAATASALTKLVSESTSASEELEEVAGSSLEENYVLLYRRESAGKTKQGQDGRGLPAAASDDVGTPSENGTVGTTTSQSLDTMSSSKTGSSMRMSLFNIGSSCAEETTQKLRDAKSDEELWKVMEVFVDEGTMADLMAVFGKLKDVRMWRLALKVFRWMQMQEWYVPSDRLYAKIISIVGKFQKTSIALTLFNEAQSIGLADNVNVYGAMIFAYSRSGMVDAAKAMVVRMEEDGIVPDAFIRKSIATGMSFRSLTRGARLQSVGNVLEQWRPEMSVEELLSSVLPAEEAGSSPMIYSQVLAHAGRFGDCEKMERVLKEMKEKGYALSEKDYNSVLSCYSRQGEVEKMGEVWEQMLAKGWQPSVHSCTTMLDGYGRKHMYDAMDKLLAVVHAAGLRRDQIMLEVLLLAFIRGQQWDRMEAIRDEVRARGYRLGAKVYFVMIEEFAKWERYDAMEKAYRELIDAGYRPDVDTYGKLIDGCKEGRKFDLMEEVIAAVPDSKRRGRRQVQERKENYVPLEGRKPSPSGRWKRLGSRGPRRRGQQEEVEMVKH